MTTIDLRNDPKRITLGANRGTVSMRSVLPTVPNLAEVQAARDEAVEAADQTAEDRAAVEALGTTTDSIIAAKINDDASATKAALSATFVASGLPRISGRAQGLKYDGTDETSKVNTILTAMSAFGGGQLEIEGPLRCDSQISIPTTTVSSQVRQAPIRIVGTGAGYGPGSTFSGGAPYSAMPGLDLRYKGRTDTGCTTTKGSAYIANTAATPADRGNIVVGAGVPDQCWILAVDAGAGWVVSRAARATGTVSLTSFGGRIQGLGYGSIEIDHLQIYNGGTASSAPFGLTTAPKVELHDCVFYGDSSKSGATCDEDPWVFGGPGQGTMLTTGLTSGNTYTTLAVQALPVAITAGRDVILGFGTGATQRVTVPSGAAAGATSITVSSFTANATYAAKTGVYIGYAQSQATTSSWSVPSAPYQGYASHVERNQFYRCRRISAGGFATDLYIEHNAWMHNCGSTLAKAPSTLTTGLTSGATVTSLAVTALTSAALAGDVFQVGVGDTTQEFTVSADAAAGATSVSVNSVAANATYAIGTKAFNTTVGLGAMVESYAIDAEINAIHVIGNRMGFSGLYNYATRFVGHTEQSVISGNNFQDVQADPCFIAGHRFERSAAFNMVVTGVLGSGVSHIADDWSSSTGLRQQTIITASQSKPSRFPQNIILGNGLQRLGGTTFTLSDTLGNTDLTISGALRTWAIKAPVNIDGNSGGAGSTALQIGNNSTASDAVITLNPPTGQAGSIQWKRAGSNSWLMYDAASAVLFLRDSVNAKMHVTYTAGSGTGGGSTEFNSALKANGAFTVPYVAKTAAYSVTDKDYTVDGDATGGAFNLTLPTASGRTGRIYVLRKSDASANAVTVVTSGGQSINGATTYPLTTQYQTVRVQCDGSNWIVI